MRVAILTDSNLPRESGLANTLEAVGRYAPSDLDPHVYRLARRDMRMSGPRLEPTAERLAADQVAAIHLTSIGPAGLLARRLADRLDLPLLGSYETDLGEHATLMTRSASVRTLVRAYLRWCTSQHGRHMFLTDWQRE